MSALPRPLVLASTSRYRAELLRRIVADFLLCAPDIDESAESDESPAATAARLAREKAKAVADRYPDHLVIGSDQVADLDGQLLGKPATLANAHAQLTRCSGRVVVFHTAVCLIEGKAEGPTFHQAIDSTRVVFRSLRSAEISRYLALDEPFDCAGSFKIECSGSTLFERVESTDPSALIGLPLIVLCGMLRLAGLTIP